MSTHETVIVGAGPAGLQLSYLFSRAGRDHVVLERHAPGAFFDTYPRHGRLLSINKRHTGTTDPEKSLRWDWNSLLTEPGDEGPLMRDFSTEYFPDRRALARYLRAFSAHHQLPVLTGVHVTRIDREGAGFVLNCAGGGRVHARRLVMATGVPEPVCPPIPGIELAEGYRDVSVDPEDFEGLDVLVIGKGNSAFETADNLVAHAVKVHVVSPTPLRLAWKTRFVGHLRAVNNNFLDTYRLKAQNGVLDATVTRLEQRGERVAATFAYTHVDEVEEIVYDRVIVCAGFRFDAAPFTGRCRPMMTIHGRFPALTSTWESTDVPGLFFAGAASQGRDYGRGTSAFIHGFRYTTRALFRFLEARFHEVPLPRVEVPGGPSALASRMIERVNRSSGLWQQFGFLADVFLEEDGRTYHHEELPLDWVVEGPLTQAERLYVVTLELGEDFEDPFDGARPHKDDPSQAHRSEALHPVVRRYCQGTLVDTHHVMEDISADFTAPVHIEPLLAWLRTERDAA